MEQTQPFPYSFTALESGVDWITCTAQGREARTCLESAAEGLLQQEAARGVEITPGRIRDYVGWQAPGIFAGKRQTDSLVRLSAAHALAHWQTVAQHATNVSRLDLQTTVWTHGEQPALSRWYYQRVRRLPPGRGRPRSFSLIQTHPAGDTLYVGKRQSDCFGRVYDYAAAHKKGEPRTVWRYEVEFKRHLASHHSAALLGCDDPRLASESVVFDWYHSRGIQPAYTRSASLRSEEWTRSAVERDVLGWFETSLSKTVAGAIRRHGLTAVLDALHLSGVVMPRKEKP
jgi:hypothetical protein